MNNQPDSEEFEKLLVYLKHARGFDFTAYKRSTLQRRVQKRMNLVNSANYAEYLDYLEVHPDEFPLLFNTILINVTSFFRDAEAWQYLSTEIIPKIIARKGEKEPIRVWVAGCASGEEAYTIAILLAQALGTEDFRKRVKIYGTDLDEEALTESRLAKYEERDIEALAPELVERYFERTPAGLFFDRELRRSVIFGRHDLIQDAPISRVDLLLCRNTLMYFNAEAQERILARFHFALNDGGFLFLGKAETLLTHASTFSPVDLKNRVFIKAARTKRRERLMLLSPTTTPQRPDVPNPLRDLALDAVPVAQIVINVGQQLVTTNARARLMFTLTQEDLGRPFHDLEVSFRPAELRSGIEQASTQRRAVVHKDVAFTHSNGETTILDIRITPLFTDIGDLIGTSITFEDITHYKRLQEELLNFNQELETAYEEVQSTNEELQTTNEELQSTVEELETTNEELQSTNEELETMNEELQSANEELETINEELRQRSEALNRANAFLESILGSLRDGVIVTDPNLAILAWNERSEDLWGLRAEEVLGKHLLNLDMGLPVDQLRQPIRACLSGHGAQALSVEATNRRGKPIACRLSFTPMHDGVSDPYGVIILTELELGPPNG